ncbi:MAG: DUF3160 domain-containing protein [Thermoplasmata archaeon]|nr:MAG: DUF3160 domain-containing protein [Thermoplasmata archaeon]
MRNEIAVILLITILVGTSISGCIQQKGETGGKIPVFGSGLIIIHPVNATCTSNPKYAIASYYKLEGEVINSSVPQYQLPLDLDDVTNMNNITKVFHLSTSQEKLLKNNGFVVIDYGRVDDIVEPYKDMKEKGIPVFVTSDTLLHLYHIQFNEILKGIEEREFFDMLLKLSKTFFDNAKADYQTFEDPDLKEAARRNVAYFGVALKLLQTPTKDYNGSEDIPTVEFTIPDYVEEEVNSELNAIEKHSGFEDSSIFHYKEDYSQYLPRGHYTRSEKLKRYFKAMMWYGRMAFLLKGGEPYCPSCDFLISEYNAKIATIQASLIAKGLTNLSVDGETAEKLWNRIYSVTSFFVGAADDLTPYEYLDCIGKVFGLKFNLTELSNDTKLFDLKLELAKLRNPKIYGGTGKCVLPPTATVEDLNKILEKTKGMRFMGQRFIPDSYIFQQLVFPAVDPYLGDDRPFTLEFTDGGPARCFPRGLDVMAVLGSKRALEILENDGDTEYGHYYEQLNNLSENFSSLNATEWNRNLYFSWVYTLKSLLKEFNQSYPTFMQTKAWLDKELQTALASWAELRHDTILYGKQSSTLVKSSYEPPPKPVVGYVEPVPEFYSRILALTKMTKNGLASLNVLKEGELDRLKSLESVIQRLFNISKDELEKKELSEEDYAFIRNFGGKLDSIVTGVKEKGKETTIVADVHTDTNTGKCLEEGVGYVDMILVAYMVSDGRVIIGAGPVFSYYEFKHPMNDRLTDEKWKKMLQANPPERASWVQSFMVE